MEPFTIQDMLINSTDLNKILCNFGINISECDGERDLSPEPQGVSVSVSTFNLVAISLERYSAICNPLTSRVWQTKSHAAKVISATWVVSFLLMLPYPISSTLKPFTRLNNSTGHMCRLVWPNDAIHQSWYVSLLLMLFLIPGIVMMTAYGLISLELYRGIRNELSSRKSRDRQSSTGSIKPGDSDGCYLQPSKRKSLILSGSGYGNSSREPAVGRVCGSSSTSNLMAKKRVIRMLLVIVFLFFLCWTPIFVVNAWQAFDRRSAHRLTGAPISFIHLLSYTSACVNPIIYCFMNKRFRQGMLATFTCCSCFRRGAARSSSLGRSAGSRTTKGDDGRTRAEQNGHTPPSGASTRFTYTGIRDSAWSELT
ncbi:cholecystokinin receptor type A isoform X2 [Cololabis saira]|uniref:cholecystokinin receptor type A isoform X2 n=1 Tax=Cololabis saira TaxID=129043 RepID=UPI002AD30D21|nr:cholecystokinin receptor type A isoform X2 [Cololabis saira]